jgi:glutaredoxin 3
MNLEYVDINLDVHIDRRNEMKERTGRKTVPQIYFNAKHIGGFSEFDALVSMA